MKQPGPDHPIAVEPFAGIVSVWVNGVEMARSESALVIAESVYPAVYYIPRSDIAMDHFRRSQKVTHCPYKGDAAHFSVTADGQDTEDVAWYYETPYDGVAGIAGHVAFYRDLAEITAEPG